MSRFIRFALLVLIAVAARKGGAELASRWRRAHLQSKPIPAKSATFDSVAHPS